MCREEAYSFVFRIVGIVYVGISELPGNPRSWIGRTIWPYGSDTRGLCVEKRRIPISQRSKGIIYVGFGAKLTDQRCSKLATPP